MDCRDLQEALVRPGAAAVGTPRRHGLNDSLRRLEVAPDEQAFLIAACEHEIRQGTNTEATEQFEARVAATLTNLAKQVQGLQTLAHAQVALTDVFLKYVITCLLEPPEDALPAARVRARLRYEKLVRAAAEGISNKNRDTLKGMLGDE
jgi:hypothetical protein